MSWSTQISYCCGRGCAPLLQVRVFMAKSVPGSALDSTKVLSCQYSKYCSRIRPPILSLLEQLHGKYFNVTTNHHPQEHLYATMFTSGEVLVERQGTPRVTDALVEALRLQWSYGFPFTPSVSFASFWRPQISKRGPQVVRGLECVLPTSVVTVLDASWELVAPRSCQKSCKLSRILARPKFADNCCSHIQQFWVPTRRVSSPTFSKERARARERGDGLTF